MTPLSAAEKKIWLSGQVRRCLHAYASDLATLFEKKSAELHLSEQFGDWRIHYFGDLRQRTLAMGDPLWYCEITLAGPTERGKTSVDGRVFGLTHMFALTLFMEYRKNKSTTLFEAMTDEQTDARSGLLPYLWNLGITREKNAHVIIRSIEADIRSVIEARFTKTKTFDIVHRLTCAIAVSDAN